MTTERSAEPKDSIESVKAENGEREPASKADSKKAEQEVDDIENE